MRINVVWFNELIKIYANDWTNVANSDRYILCNYNKTRLQCIVVAQDILAKHRAAAA